MRSLTVFFAVAVLLIVAGSTAMAQTGQISDSEYMTQALSAAPEAVAKDAAVVRVEKDGTMRTLRSGKNGFTCMIVGTDRMCNDANSMEFIEALMKHQAPPDKVGISYMLAGDKGASNTDPYATGRTADNHWVVTGPHIMIFGPPTKTMGYTRAKDPDASQPYMMWAGTPYEHAMIPVGTAK
jgi:outer membrane receptor for monomeric catechols